MEIGENSAFVESESTKLEIQDLVDDDNIKLVSPPAPDEEKQELANAISYLRKTLIEFNFISATESSAISIRSVLIGRKLLKRFFDMCGSMDFVDQEVLISTEGSDSVHLEQCVGKTHTAVKTPGPTKKMKIAKDITSSDSNEEEDEQDYQKVPYAAKIKAVQLAELHPQWSIKSLRSKSTRLLTNRAQLARRKIHIEKGGTRFDKLEVIRRCVYDRFIEARDEKGALVTTRMLQQWAMAAASQFLDGNFEFHASHGWTNDFKSKHRISQRHVTKYVSQKDK